MKILWWRIVAAGVVLELLYGVFIFAILGSNAAAYTSVGLAAVFLMMMIGGVWVGRSAGSMPVAQGALVGVAAVSFYLTLLGVFFLLGAATDEAAATEETPMGLWLLNHALKILGGAVGGYIGGSMLTKRHTR